MANSSKDIADWNQIAQTYTKNVGVPEDRIYSQFKEVLWNSLGDLKGLSVLDVGCGHGWLSYEFQKVGAFVTGIDGSTALLKEAKKRYPNITFLQHDLTKGLPKQGQTFDRIVSHMVVMDLPEIDLLLTDLRKVIKPDGRFIFTMPHPCFFNYGMRRDEKTGQPFRAVTGYHKEEVWRIEGFGGHNHYHRNLTYYFDKLRNNGFAVTRLFEPEHIPSTESELSEFWRSIPVFILIEAVSYG